MGGGWKVKSKRFFFEKKKEKILAKLGRWRWRGPELDEAVSVYRRDQIAKTEATF